MSESKVNEEAIRLAVKAIEANPENWDQSHWNAIKFPGVKKVLSWGDVELVGNSVRIKPEAGELYGLKGLTEWVQVEQCQTTYCLAGQALLQAGMIDGRGRYTNEDGVQLNNYQVEKLAADLLGLDEYQADELFYWGVQHHLSGTLGEFKEHITQVTGVRFEDE